MVRAFVLCTGRCGSRTLTHACRHIENYTAGHETRARQLDARLDYPDQHIEADNRLSWFLGSLHRRYGDDPVYVHLRRDPDAVARSYAHRFRNPVAIMPAYASRIIMRRTPPADLSDRLEAARHYVDTVTDNIDLFLAERPRTVEVWIEDPEPGFTRMWELLGATGSLPDALTALTERIGRR